MKQLLRSELFSACNKAQEKWNLSGKKGFTDPCDYCKKLEMCEANSGWMKAR